MCGIAGIIYKDKKTHNVGKSLTSMLESLQHRGPDSAGFAIYGGLNLQKNNYQLNIEVKNRPELLKQIKDTILEISPIFNEELIKSDEKYNVYRCEISLEKYSMLKPLIRKLDEIEEIQVINGSHSFEMIKDIGKVKDIAKRYNVQNRIGTHGIGHTRFATESGIDRYHAHPYQSYITPDITVVHNGQITNYWKIRDPLERKGHIFESLNDTECIVHYIADKLYQGYKLEEALEEAVKDLDGPFSILVGTPNGIGIAKDKLGLRPGVMAENDDIFAIASEEMSLQDVLDTDHVEQIAPGETRSYTL
ncbi:glutamine amidotransferase [Methanosphaera sp.]|uniref:glutamine amidotransferase n=1 Tax=Methanosphaera sp. TaxID=2666342 RepID=UPI002E75C3F8|nr:glutamine amidotransferase [Methanosphaera sp.]MEE1117794.1 glutamine amidotransferase [Methanosphaera sp.]